MCNCNPSDCPPQNITLDSLADLTLNQVRPYGSGCAPRGRDDVKAARLAERGFSFPKNGEFKVVNSGIGCNMSSNRHGCEASRGPGVSGTRPALQRINYHGDATNCCITRASTNGQYTCDPRFRTYETGYCDEIMYNYCILNKDQNIQKRECIDWVSGATKRSYTRIIPDIQNYCKVGENFKTDFCQNWCRNVRSSSIPNSCDPVLLEYCNNHPNDPNCECIDPENKIDLLAQGIKAQGIEMPKSCWFAPCRRQNNDNYKTSDMLRPNCNAVICNIEVNDVEITGDGQIILNNDCVLNTQYGIPELPKTPTTPTTPPNNNGNNTPPSTPNSNSLFGPTSMLLLSCSFFVFIIIIVLFIFFVI